MLIRRCLASLALVVISATPSAAGVITFDEFAVPDGNTGALASPYQGFTWVNFSLLDPGGVFAGSGYENGLVSSENVAFTSGFGYFSSATPFTFDSVYMSAAWRDGVRVRVIGLLGATELFSTSFLVDHTGPNLFTFNWGGINTVHIATSGGVEVPGLVGSGEYVAIDNIAINTVPEPTSLLLLGTGIVGVAARVRNRRRKQQA
jgi:hypothetical protein